MTDINNPRTLSGTNNNTLNQIRLPSTEDAILIDGDEGLPNQGIFKNGITGKLEWDYAETTSIPDGSITGAKLKPDITINTTGNIDANIIKGHTILGDVVALPKSGTQTLALTNTGITLVGQQQINADGSGATFNELTLKGSGGVDPTMMIEIGDLQMGDGDIIMYGGENITFNVDGSSGAMVSTGNITTDGNITADGNITTNNGDVLVNNGNKIDFFTDDGTNRTFDIRWIYW
jgi:hypothetical protein